MKKKISGSNLIIGLIFIVGLSLLLYPSVSNKWNSYHASKLIQSYESSVNELDEKAYKEILEKAEEYNRQVAVHPLGTELTDEQKEKYYSVLDITGTGIMGYIEIPSINVKLPIYHGTEKSALQIATGHLEWTALPVGGDSTHCVISGHRGLPSAKLLTDLDEVNIGDIFKVSVLNETYTYEVDKISVVLPDQTSELSRVIGKDYLTVFTCTPYGINTHRLLVRAHRIDNVPDEARVTAEANVINPLIVAIVIFTFIMLVMACVYTIRSKKKKAK